MCKLIPGTDTYKPSNIYMKLKWYKFINLADILSSVIDPLSLFISSFLSHIHCLVVYIFIVSGVLWSPLLLIVSFHISVLSLSC